MKKTNLLTTLLSCVATANFLASTAQATSLILLDNTNGLTSWNTSGAGVWFGNSTPYNRLIGMTFVTGNTSYDLDSISVAMAFIGTGTPSISPNMRLSLYENSSSAQSDPADGATATYTEDFNTFSFNSTQQIYTLSPSGVWNMKANTSYSVSLATDYPNTDLQWQVWSGTASSSYGFTQTSPFISTDGGGTFLPLTENQSFSMQVTGVTAGVTAVPEPGGFVATSLLLGAAGLIRRRQARAA